MCPSPTSRPLPASPDLPVASAGQCAVQTQPTGRGAAPSFPRGTHDMLLLLHLHSPWHHPPSCLAQRVLDYTGQSPSEHQERPPGGGPVPILERILGPHNRRTLRVHVLTPCSLLHARNLLGKLGQLRVQLNCGIGTWLPVGATIMMV